MTLENAAEAADLIHSKTELRPRIAIVLGSGLGAFADELEDAVSIPYERIPHFVRSTVEGHAGRLVIGTCGGVPVAVQQGRFHFYEGYSMEQVMFPMRVFGRMGVEAVILTNAAGSLKAGMRPGDLMLIADHINMMGVNRFAARMMKARPAVSGYDAGLRSGAQLDRRRSQRHCEGARRGGEGQDFQGFSSPRRLLCAPARPTKHRRRSGSIAHLGQMR